MGLAETAIVRDYNPRVGSDVLWLGLSPQTSHRKARETFRARYGRFPLAVRRRQGVLLVGPVDADERDNEALELSGRDCQIETRTEEDGD
jgi:hypothetical protein